MKSKDQEIIEITIKWIKEDGYETVSLRKLAQELNITAPAIYKHFRNKDELLAAATRQLSTRFISNLHLDSKLSAEEKLLVIAQLFCRKFEEETNLMDFLFFNSHALSVLQPQSENKYPFLKEVKKLVHEANMSNTPDAELFIKLWSFIQGYALLIKNHVVKYQSDLVESSLKQLLGEKEE